MSRSSADRSPVEHWSRKGVSTRNELRFANGATKRNVPHTIVRSLHRTRRWSPKSLLYVEKMAHVPCCSVDSGHARAARRGSCDHPFQHPDATCVSRTGADTRSPVSLAHRDLVYRSAVQLAAAA